MIKVCFTIILVLTCMPSFFTLAVRNWGENCTNSDECFDHRMVCVPDEENVTRCFCDRFHKWNGSSVGCMQIYSAAYIMNQTVQVHDNVGRMDRMQEHMFRGPLYSIYFMMFIIVTCSLSVVIYCLYIRKKDHELRAIVAHIMVESDNRSRSVLQRQQTTSRC